MTHTTLCVHCSTDGQLVTWDFSRLADVASGQPLSPPTTPPVSPRSQAQPSPQLKAAAAALTALHGSLVGEPAASLGCAMLCTAVCTWLCLCAVCRLIQARPPHPDSSPHPCLQPYDPTHCRCEFLGGCNPAAPGVLGGVGAPAGGQLGGAGCPHLHPHAPCGIQCGGAGAGEGR